MLCNKIFLNRIEPEYFKEHIQQAFYKRWRIKLEQELMDKIISLTECHPYYVNMLCDKLWEIDHKPALKDIAHAWDEALFENRGKIIADLDPLKTNRIKILITIALLDSVKEPNAKSFLDKVKMPLGSVQNAIQYLLDNDYLYETQDGLKLTDPLMKKFIVQRYL